MLHPSTTTNTYTMATNILSGEVSAHLHDISKYSENIGRIMTLLTKDYNKTAHNPTTLANLTPVLETLNAKFGTFDSQSSEEFIGAQLLCAYSESLHANWGTDALDDDGFSADIVRTKMANILLNLIAINAFDPNTVDIMKTAYICLCSLA